MSSEKHQRLFSCSNYSIVNPGLEGLSFDMLRESKSGYSLRAWAGDNCTFNKIVNLIAEQAKIGYRFSTLAAMFKTPARAKISRPSTPFYEGKIIRIGSEETKRKSSLLLMHAQIFNTFPWAAFQFLFMAYVLLAVTVAHRLSSGHTSLSACSCCVVVPANL